MFKKLILFCLNISSYSALHSLDYSPDDHHPLGHPAGYDSDEDQRENPLKVKNTFAASLESSALQSSCFRRSDIPTKYPPAQCPIKDCYLDFTQDRRIALQHIFSHFNKGYTVPAGYSFIACYQCSCGTHMKSRNRWNKHKGSCPKGEAARLLFNTQAEMAACEILHMPLPHRCQIADCRQMFGLDFSEEAIARHYLTCHQDIEPSVNPLPASIAKVATKRKADQQLSGTDKKSKGTPRYRCSQCNQTFVQLSLVHGMMHLEKDMDIGENLYECNACDKGFKTKSDIVAHVAVSPHKTRINEHIKKKAHSLLVPI